jgi:hypothetical protein
MASRLHFWLLQVHGRAIFRDLVGMKQRGTRSRELRT